jgi:hypothetical protein
MKNISIIILPLVLIVTLLLCAPLAVFIWQKYKKVREESEQMMESFKKMQEVMSRYKEQK